MSDEPFIARWSRRKRGVADPKTEPEAPPRTGSVDAKRQGDTRADGRRPPAREPEEPPFDPASLPSIESITANTDIRAFLRSGVPAELTKAALRKMWTADPAIRDFIGIAENQWDFTDPSAIPGFGTLEARDSGRLLAQALGKLDEETTPAPEPPDAPEPRSVRRPEKERAEQEETAAVASSLSDEAPAPAGAQNERSEATAAPGRRRRHGSALPRQS